MDQVLSGLGNRVFLMNNVHEDSPTIFQSRWALSYLRGPINSEQIRTLMNEKRATANTSKVAAQHWVVAPLSRRHHRSFHSTSRYEG